MIRRRGALVPDLIQPCSMFKIIFGAPSHAHSPGSSNTAFLVHPAPVLLACLIPTMKLFPFLANPTAPHSIYVPPVICFVIPLSSRFQSVNQKLQLHRISNITTNM
ncbi:hypothetical protein K439DRAFT_892311 [Ramaria rubella]|nr:hypothetical protein K439DRAFT_892311 [Ramaria rubella]